eukprot:10434683-Ditylum_brightwellii.AAC.1
MDAMADHSQEKCPNTSLCWGNGVYWAVRRLFVCWTSLGGGNVAGGARVFPLLFARKARKSEIEA